jgi:hypothetical protein
VGEQDRSEDRPIPPGIDNGTECFVGKITNTCIFHPAMPALRRRTERIFPVVDSRAGRRSAARLVKIMCATGHMYYAIDPDEFVDDPFSEDEESSVFADEGFPIPPEFGDEF